MNGAWWVGGAPSFVNFSTISYEQIVNFLLRHFFQNPKIATNLRGAGPAPYGFVS